MLLALFICSPTETSFHKGWNSGGHTIVGWDLATPCTLMERAREYPSFVCCPPKAPLSICGNNAQDLPLNRT